LKTLTPNQTANCEIDWLTLREPALTVVTP